MSSKWLFVSFDSKVKAEDLDTDANGKIVYSIDFGNSDGYFSINENTGEINLAKTIPLVENRILEFPLHILARDGRSEQFFSSFSKNSAQLAKNFRIIYPDCNVLACYNT